MSNLWRMPLIVTLLSLLMACTRAYYQPPKPDWEYYQKAGTTALERKKAILECSWKVNPGGPPPKALSLEHVTERVLKAKCLKKAGFYKEPDFEICDHYNRMQTIPLCSQPLSAAPDRDINVRLNSRFCHNFPKAEACVP